MSKPWEERWRRYDLALKAAAIQAKLLAPHRAWVEAFLKELRPRKWWAAGADDVRDFLLEVERKGRPAWQREQASTALRIFFQEAEPAPWAAAWPGADTSAAKPTEQFLRKPTRKISPLPTSFLPVFQQAEKAVVDASLAPLTGRAYLGWVRRFLASRPSNAELLPVHAAEFLTALPQGRSLSPSTLAQAGHALRFFYSAVLRAEVSLPRRAKTVRHSPRALSASEMDALLDKLPGGSNRLLAQLLYATGITLAEAVRLRVRHLAFEGQVVVIEEGTARSLPLPPELVAPLWDHLDQVQKVWENDRAGEADLADGCNAWRDYWVFPSERARVVDGRIRRGSIHPQSFQQLLSRAAKRAGLVATPQTLRYSFAQRRLEEGLDLPGLQRLLGLADLTSVTRYARALSA